MNYSSQTRRNRGENDQVESNFVTLTTKFKILGGGAKENSRIRTLDIRKEDFNKLRDLVDRNPLETSLRGKGVQETWLYFKEVFLKVQEQVILRE